MSDLFISLLAHAVVGFIAIVIIAFLLLVLAHLWRLIKNTLGR